jgi:hypothetical protein
MKTFAKLKNWYVKNMTNKLEFNILQKELLARIKEEEPNSVPEIIFKNWVSQWDIENPMNEKSEIIAMTEKTLYGIVGYHSRYNYDILKKGEINGERYHFKTGLDSKTPEEFVKSMQKYAQTLEHLVPAHFDDPCRMNNSMKVIVS